MCFDRHGLRKEANLNTLRRGLKHLINLVFQAARQHLVGIVEDNNADQVDAECAAEDHVTNTAGCADNNVDVFLQLADVVTHAGVSNAGEALRLHEFAQPVDKFVDCKGMFAAGC